MLNKVALIGMVGRTPELKKTKSGKSYVSLSVATTEGFGDKQKTEWHNVMVWEALAEATAKFVDKGSKVYVDGRIESYAGKEGDSKVYQIVCKEIKFLDTKKNSSSSKADFEDIPF